MGKVKEEKKDTGKVKEGMKERGKGKVGRKGEERAWGRSEGGWILGRDGHYRADPNWVSENPVAQPSLDKGPTQVIYMPKSDFVGSVVGGVVKDAPPTEKAKKAKTKWTKVSSGTTVYEKQAMASDGQVGGLARAQAALDKQGYGLFPASFNEEYQTSGDPVFTAAVEGLEQCKDDGKKYKLNKTKTFKFLHSDSSEVVWEAIKLANPKGTSSYQYQHSTAPIVVSVGEGKTGSVLPDAPIPQYNSKMSQRRKEELKSQKTAFNDKTTYLKSWPEKQARTGKSKCGFWGRRRSKKEKAKKEEEMMAMKEKKKPAKAKKEFWHESWRRRKEEKARLAYEKEEEEMARQRKEHFRSVSPLDLNAQVNMTYHH